MTPLRSEGGYGMTVSSPPVADGSRTKAFLLGVLVTLLAAAAAVAALRDGTVSRDDVGSGVTATQVRQVAPFASLDVAGSNVVTVHVGATQRVSVHGDGNLIDRITTTVRHGRLVIDTRGSFDTSAPMGVEVTVPHLTAIGLSGSGTISVEGIDEDAFTVRLGGSGTIDLAGTTRRLDAVLDGSGRIRTSSLTANDATASIPGSGVIDLSASGTLDATIGGSGSIICTGHPDRVTRHITGSGSVIVT
jgi:putative autotransporter adhesin-like protein